MTVVPIAPIDWSVLLAVIQLGVLIVGIVGAGFVFKTRMEEMVKNQEKLLTAFTERFEIHEESDRKMFEGIQNRFLDVVGGLQRVIGETSVFRQQPRDGRDRR
jgi:hypothetical protein